MTSAPPIYQIITTIFFLLTTAVGYSQPTVEKNEKIYAEIDSLIDAKDYFRAREKYMENLDRLSELHRLKSGVFLDNVFNHPDSSIHKMKLLLTRHASEISDSLKFRMLSINHVNYSKLFEYKKAKETLERLLAEYPHWMTGEEEEDHRNTLAIWSALEDQPKQQIEIDNTVNLEITRDKAQLQNLMVTRDTVKQHFVFDTGANLSTITETTAKRFGLVLMDGIVNVDAATGNKIKSRIAIAPELSLDGLTVRNAVFLVFPDEALAFPQINYQIHGIIGFPVIEGMKEIQITRNNRFIVPKERTSSSQRNLAIDFLTPLIYLKDKTGWGTYALDTGAKNSMLYDIYFAKNKEELNTSYNETEVSFGGVGGIVTKKGMYMTFEPEINNRTIGLDSIVVLKEAVKPDNHYLGNIGQDLIRKFEKVTFNFQDMFIRFD
ncbi:retropepsin-like aspartic protease [Sinomicrobium weinanense]|uniref:Retropepsin-like domain-containing protein n=1 Tax=Sinomicrobium weinanense TaxID=2842200 RepID=A0A926Q1Y1_9FLAO|nr:retropepsin-like aspartic protease [Sinomicrobium weinanense]MBC9796117.1 retropepsin-like domain-containing protein [Sinomicrobium weinanense]MBU3124786.1 retropepsin-like domain-containing protein [Sinomicrobium weinanense]